MKGVGNPGEWNFFTRSIKQLFGTTRKQADNNERSY